MNLHIFHSELEKYPKLIVNKIISLEEKAGNNIFLNIPNADVPLLPNIYNLKIDYKLFKVYIENLPELTHVIFHPYEHISVIFLKELKKKQPWIKVHWVSWSHDYYNLIYDSSIYDEFSLNYVHKPKKVSSIKKIVLNCFGVQIHKIRRMRNKLYTSNILTIDSFKYIDYFYNAMYDDYLFLQNISKKAKHIKWRNMWYNNIESVFPSSLKLESIGNKIIIGHSSSPANNQYEILLKIAEFNLNKNLIIPLSYGDEKYKYLLIDETNKLFKQRIEIIAKFLSTDKYYAKLTEVGFAIFNFKISLAVGNIIILLMMGIKVFLSERTSIYKLLRGMDVHIFSVEKELDKEQLSQKLSLQEIKRNREILNNHFSKEVTDEFWKPII